MTPTDIKAYKQHLLVVERRKASTVNCRLAALSAYAKWALATGLIHSAPTVNVKPVKKERGLLPENWRALRLGYKFSRNPSLDALD